MSLATKNLPTLPPWLIGQAQVTQKPFTDGFGLNVVHALGDGPDNLKTLLYDFDCKNPVTGVEAIGISNENFSDPNDFFSYEIDIYPLNINNSSLLTLDTTDVLTGKSIGHIKFCTIAVTQLDLSSSKETDYLNVSFLKTQFKLTFNLTSNEFSNEVTLDYPIATSTVTVTLNVQQVQAPSNATQAAVIAGVLTTVLTNILSSFPLPSNTQLTITPLLLNGFLFNNLLNMRRLQALLVPNGSLSFDFAIALTLTCTGTFEQCQALQTQQITNLMAQIQTALLNALLNGSVEQEIQNQATVQNVTALQNATVPTSNNLNATGIEHGNFSGVFADDLDFEIYNQYSVTACQCDEFSLQCLTGPTSVKQNEVFAICITPSSTDVHISNLDMTITGDNGFTYSPVTYGNTSYVANAPISQVFDFHTILVKTYLVGGFFNVGDGSSTVSVTGNAFLENSPAKFSVTTSSNFEIFLKIDVDEEVGIDDIERGCLKSLLMKFIR